MNNKFRVWNHTVAGGCYIAKGMTIQDFQKDASESLELPMLMSEKGVVIQQFTGLTDKNGVDIYEGDILQATTGELFVVQWRKAYSGYQYCLDRIGRDEDFYGGMGPSNDRDVVDYHEVVGNIFENPELMK